jgi:hypothetical protein
MAQEIVENLDSYDELLNTLIYENEVDGKNYLLKEDFEKFFIKGNKAAGTRIRKVMQKIRRIAEKVRKDIQDVKQEI